jgi:hypothetical protein
MRSLKTETSRPEWQSQTLLVSALAATGAAAAMCAIYAWQSASPSQAIFGIATDAALKTAAAVLADVGVALGAIVTMWLLQTGRKARRPQIIVAATMTALSFGYAVGNLSGYYAWTRDQRQLEAVHANPAYAIAELHARQVLAGARPYLLGGENRMLEQGQSLATADRKDGDWWKAIGLHALILGFGAAYRLPASRKTTVRVRSRRSAGKPKLVVSN